LEDGIPRAKFFHANLRSVDFLLIASLKQLMDTDETKKKKPKNSGKKRNWRIRERIKSIENE